MVFTYVHYFLPLCALEVFYNFGYSVDGGGLDVGKGEPFSVADYPLWMACVRAFLLNSECLRASSSCQKVHFAAATRCELVLEVRESHK